MKSLLFILVPFFCFATSVKTELEDSKVTVDTDEFAQDLVLTFGDKSEIRKWAEESSWGGWNLVELKTKESIAVFRHYTSGIDSGDLTLFKRKEEKWIRVSYFDPVFRAHYEINEQKGKLEIFKVDHKNRRKIGELQIDEI